MNGVLERARLLGEAIVGTEEYGRMQLAEAALSEDPGVEALRARVRETRSALDAARREEDPDEETVRALEAALEAHEQQLRAMPSMMEALEAREAFSRLMGRVNQILEFTLTGGISEGGCSGRCSDCSGCSPR